MQQNKIHKIEIDINKTSYDDLKQQILSASQNYYVEGVFNANNGFSHTTTLELLNHQCDSYGTITPSEMEDATNTMVTPYDPFNAIIELFIKIEKRVQIADA